MSTKSKTGILESMAAMMLDPSFTAAAKRIESITDVSVVVATTTETSLEPVLKIVRSSHPPVKKIIKTKIERSNERLVHLSGDVPIHQANDQPIDATGQRHSDPTIDTFNKQCTDVTSELLEHRSSNTTVYATIDTRIDTTKHASTEPAVDTPTNLTVDLSQEQRNYLSSKPLSGLSSEQSIERAEGRATRSIWAPLAENQGRILVFLFEVAAGLTNVDIVSAETNIAYGTVRKCLEVLVKEGYILEKRRYNGRAFNGFEYAMNARLCTQYLTKVRGEQSTERSPGQTIERTIGRTSNPFSSSVFKEDLKPTTKNGISAEVRNEILADPELRFWAGEGVTEKQVKTWMGEFELSQEEVSVSLRYGRFDILERGNIENAANWFYKMLVKNGFYPKPTNYRSLLEIKAEALRQQQQSDREAKTKMEEMEFNNRFYEFLADQSSPLYTQLLDQVSAFSKEQMKDGDKMAVEIELRDLFAGVKKHL